MKILAKVTDDPHTIIHGQHIASYLNPYQYIKLRKRPDLLRNVDLFFFDGMLLPRLLKLLGFPSYKNHYPDMSGFFPDLFRSCSRNGYRIALVGGSTPDIRSAVGSLQRAYPELIISAFHHGYFPDEDNKLRFARALVDLEVKFVIVGMGAILQEEFLISLKHLGFRGCGIACGAFIHQSAKSLEYFPSSVIRLNCRWLYRVLDEPILLARYLLIYPVGVWLFFKDALNGSKPALNNLQ